MADNGGVEGILVVRDEGSYFIPKDRLAEFEIPDERAEQHLETLQANSDTVEGFALGARPGSPTPQVGDLGAALNPRFSGPKFDRHTTDSSALHLLIEGI